MKLAVYSIEIIIVEYSENIFQGEK